MAVKGCTLRCVNCGATIAAGGRFTARLWMSRYSMCKVCAEIKMVVDESLPYECIDGNVFVPKLVPVGERTTGQQIWGIRENGELVRWQGYEKFYGTAKGAYKQLFSDTLKYIPPGTVKPREGRVNMCANKGCLDRETCYWYHGTQDYNEIPEGVMKGVEECPSYLDKSIILKIWQGFTSPSL